MCASQLQIHFFFLVYILLTPQNIVIQSNKNVIRQLLNAPKGLYIHYHGIHKQTDHTSFAKTDKHN